MSWLGRIRDTVAPARRNAEIREELAYHTARAEASIGNLDRLEERTRDMDILVWLESWLQDLRHAARMLRRTPGLTAVIVVSLAVGIGANAAIFSLVNEVLLRTLPVPHPEQIVLLSQSDGKRAMPLLSFPVVQQMARAAGDRATVGAASSGRTLHLGADGRGPSAHTQLITGPYFQALGLHPVLGRWITADDNRALGASPVAVLSYGFWRSQFGGARDIIGRRISVSRTELQVVGVAPPGFTGLDPASTTDLWIPVQMQSALRYSDSRSSVDGDSAKPWPPQERILWLETFARIPNPALEPALAAQWKAISARSWKRIAPGYDLPLVLSSGARGSASLRATYTAPLVALMAMVGLMLLIAIANVAALLLARMVRRRREMGIRIALGVGRARLARQLMTEGLLLAAISGVAAVAVALWLSRLLVGLAAGGGRAPFQPDLDWRVWAFLALAALGAGIVLGLLPAWQAYRRGPGDALKSGDSRTSTGDRVPLGRALVIAQVGFTLLLAVGAVLFSRSLAAMMHENLGFDRDHVLSATVTLPDPPPAGLATTQRDLLERIAALPGVRAAAWDVNGIAQNSRETSGVNFPGQPADAHLQAGEDTVTADYLDATGMQLRRGRNFAPTDRANSPAVVLVNQAFARRFYPGQDPLGKTFGYDPQSTSHFHVVGVLADARVDDPHAPAEPLFYKLAAQSPDNLPSKLQIRAAGDPATLVPAVRAVLASRFRVDDVSPLQTRLVGMLSRDRLVSELSAGFGLLALALACLGLYGVMSYAVAARRGEFGVRMALGASRGSLLGLIWRETGLLLAAGLCLGVPLTLLAAHWAQPLLPGVGATDPVALAGGVLVTALLPWLAALRPAWAAAHADPVAALRAD